jgi:competence protein ComEA
MRKFKESMAQSAMVFVYSVMLLSVCLTGCGESVYESVAQEAAESEGASQLPPAGEASVFDEEKKTEQTAGKEIVVYVCGAVIKPGVYTLPEGARVYQAIARAGGLTEEADELRVNQAACLMDGQQVSVLTKEESEGLPVPDGGVFGEGQTAAGGRVNINTAGEDELVTLSGIGPSRAQDIIAYRKANGAFREIEDIMKVSGIKAQLFQKIKDRITTG